MLVCQKYVSQSKPILSYQNMKGKGNDFPLDLYPVCGHHKGLMPWGGTGREETEVAGTSSGILEHVWKMAEIS